MHDDELDTRKKKHNDARELQLIVMGNLMKTEGGRAFMWRCLQNCCTFETIYNSDASKHDYNSGKRDHGLWLDQELRTAAKDNYYLMLKENR